MEKYSEEEIESLIVQSAKEGNILPIISRCDSNCIFCSHHNNPKEVRVVSIGTRSFEKVMEVLPYLNGNEEITIGESASNIIEGEPTLHPQFVEILTAIRRTYPKAPVAVTTNGRYLTKELLEKIASVGNVRLNLSMNSASIEGRQKLMHDTIEMAQTAIASVPEMKRLGIRFSASMVGMPNVAGYDDIAATIRYLANNGATSVQIFLPGFSSFVKEEIFPDADTIYDELKAFIGSLSAEIACPVMLEPSCVKDLIPQLSGVLSGTPAWRAGLRRGDVIREVNGQMPRSRVEAYGMLGGAGTKKVTYERAGERHQVMLNVGADGQSGVSVEYDYDLRNAPYLLYVINSAPGKVLAMTGEFAYPVIHAVFELLKIPAERAQLIAVKNHTFGGTIRAAGLLTNADYVRAYREYIKENEEPAALLIPQISYNYLGKDLCGHSWEELKEQTGKAVALIQ
jgi:hypothetical protein